MYYVLARDGELVGITVVSPYGLDIVGVSIHEFDGPIPDLNLYTWDIGQEALIRDPTARSLTKLQFTNRLTMQERLAISASPDPVVADIMRMLNIAEYINLDDINTIQSMQYFVMTGLLAQPRFSEILQ